MINVLLNGDLTRLSQQLGKGEELEGDTVKKLPMTSRGKMIWNLIM